MSFQLQKTTRRFRSGTSLLLFLVAAIQLGCGGSGETEQVSTRVVNIVTAPPGGAWYAIGGVLASLINESVPNVQAIPETTGGAEENVRLVGTGQSDLGFVILKTALQGYRGESPFQQPYSDLRVLLASLDVGRIHAVVNAGSSLQDICGLKGTRVAVGPSGHGSLSNLREIFSSGCEFTFDEITPVYLPYGQSLSALGDGRVDAAILYISPPAAAISEFGASHDYRLLPMSEAARDALVAQYSYYRKIDIPANAYGAVPSATPVVGTANGVMVNAGLPEELVYEIAKAIFENIDRLRGSYPTLGQFSLDVAVQDGLIPFHDGAIRYYQETGVWPEAAPAGEDSPPTPSQ